MFCALLAVSAAAQPAPEGRPEGGEPPILGERFQETLGTALKFSAEQKKGVSAAMESARPALKAEFAKLREAQKKLEEQAQKFKSMEMDLREKIRAQLRNEQKERFDEMMQRMREGGRRGAARGEETPFGGAAREREFPPERWEENPERGRRQRPSQGEMQEPLQNPQGL
ncbi:MAG: hypothetical protein WC969_13745 [Elusimicrobiota bacterium]|jgi:hypothetical protein